VGRSPLFVDTDIGQGEISLPGCLSAVTVDRSCLSVEEEGFLHASSGAVGTSGHDSLASSSSSSSSASVSSAVKSSAPAAASTLPLPLVYCFGHATPGDAAGGEVFKNSLHRLADTVTRRLTHDEHSRVSGCIVNTMGFIDGLGYDILLDTVKTMQCDVVIVQGNDRLFARLSEDLKSIKLPIRPTATGAAPSAGSSSSSAAGAGVEVAASSTDTKSVALLKLPRSGGVVERSRNTRRDTRKQRIKEYFYGPTRVVITPPPSNAVGAAPTLTTLPPVLSPVSLTLSFDDVTIVRVGGFAVSWIHSKAYLHYSVIGRRC
jgi:polyribonucleotide 5'-hydroxyl-kinase